MASGRFITFEGGEGSGKSTQTRKLAEWLTERGVAVTMTHEPGATDFGLRVRSILLDSADGSLTPRAEALLFAADRAHHVDTVIRPALDRGEVVITDRYVDSSLAYQGAGRALSLEDIRRLSRWATNGLRPDLTVLLDVDPDIGLQRARSGGRADRLERESLDFHERVRRAFRALADAAPDRYLVVDASRQPEAVAAVVRTAVAKRLAARLAAQRPLSRSERAPSGLRWLRRSRRNRAPTPSAQAGRATAAPPTGSARTPPSPVPVPPPPPAAPLPPPAAPSAASPAAPSAASRAGPSGAAPTAPPAASSSADATPPSARDDAAGGLRR